MGYSAIATFLHATGRKQSAFEMAIALAQKTGAHLHVLCAGVDASEPGFYYAGAHAIALRQNPELAQEEAKALETLARERLACEDVSWDLQTIAVQPGGLASFISDTMRFHDLVVLPAPYQSPSDHWDVEGFEACLFGADRPVLIVPEDAPAATDFTKILIGWDDSLPALAATQAARPFIRRAERATITMIEPSSSAPDRSDPGGRLAQYLMSYGAHVEISVCAKSQPSIGAQLLSSAQAKGTGLIVMGAYTKSRMRETILGGATRDILRLTTVPVLMAH